MKLKNFLPKGTNATLYVTNLYADARKRQGLPDADSWAIDEVAANQVVTDLYERISATCEDPDDADAIVMQQLPAALLAANVAMPMMTRTTDDADGDSAGNVPATDGQGAEPADQPTPAPEQPSHPNTLPPSHPNTPAEALQRVLDRIPADHPNRDQLVKAAANFRKLFGFDQVHDAPEVTWNMPDPNHIEVTAREKDGTEWYQKEDIKNGGRKVTVTESNGTKNNFKSAGALEDWMQKVEDYYDQNPDATKEEFNEWKQGAIQPYTTGKGGKSKNGSKNGKADKPETSSASADQQPTASADGEQTGNSSTDATAPTEQPEASASDDATVPEGSPEGQQPTDQQPETDQPYEEDFGCTYLCPSPKVWIHVLPKGDGHCLALQFVANSDPAHYIREDVRELKPLAKRLDALKCQELDTIPVPVLMYLIQHGYVMKHNANEQPSAEQSETEPEPMPDHDPAQEPQPATEQPCEGAPSPTEQPTDEQPEAPEATVPEASAEEQQPQPEPEPAKPEPTAAKRTEGEYRHPATRLIRAALRAFRKTGKYPYLYGPTGTGKTHVCEQLAEDFGVRFTSNGTIYEPTDLVGYPTANGGYVKTPFLMAYANGGLHLFDEIDRSNPGALVVVHSAIANGFIDLVNGERIYMHPDFLLVGAGNTLGKGYDSQYTAAQPLDKASRNRMTPIKFTYDEGIERRVAHEDAELIEFIHKFRASITKAEYDHDLSYREMSALYEYSRDTDLTLEEAVKMSCLEGIEVDDLTNLVAPLPSSNRYALAAKNVARKMRIERNAA